MQNSASGVLLRANRAIARRASPTLNALRGAGKARAGRERTEPRVPGRGFRLRNPRGGRSVIFRHALARLPAGALWAREPQHWATRAGFSYESPAAEFRLRRLPPRDRAMARANGSARAPGTFGALPALARDSRHREKPDPNGRETTLEFRLPRDHATARRAALTSNALSNRQASEARTSRTQGLK